MPRPRGRGGERTEGVQDATLEDRAWHESIDRLAYRVDLVHEPEEVGHLEVIRIAGRQSWLPIRLFRQEGISVALQKPHKHLADDPTAHLPQSLALALHLRLLQNVVPQGCPSVEPVLAQDRAIFPARHLGRGQSRESHGVRYSLARRQADPAAPQ